MNTKTKTTMLVACFAIMLCGCARTDEKKIEKAMKEYVKSNFANPNDYSGILSVELIDTIDFAKISLRIVEEKPIFDSIFKVRNDYIFEAIQHSNEVLDRLKNWTFKPERLSYYEGLLKKESENLFYSMMAIGLSYDQKSDSVYCVKIDSLLDATKFEKTRRYDVKAKVRQQGQVEYIIKNYEAHVFGRSGTTISKKDGDDYNLADFHIRDEKKYLMLMDLTSKIAKYRTEVLNTLEKGYETAKKVNEYCGEAKRDYY